MQSAEGGDAVTVAGIKLSVGSHGQFRQLGHLAVASNGVSGTEQVPTHSFRRFGRLGAAGSSIDGSTRLDKEAGFSMISARDVRAVRVKSCGHAASCAVVSRRLSCLLSDGSRHGCSRYVVFTANLSLSLMLKNMLCR